MNAGAPPDATTIDTMAGAEWLGRVIDGRYRIDAVLGEGGMGAVFVAEHLKLRNRVALKVILPQHAGNDELAQRFAREAMVSARLEHPNIASALDYGALAEGGAYIVMNLARGRSLRSIMDSGGGWQLACDVGAPIADALATAHAQGVVHRDLKPENVVVERRDDGGLLPKVLDFGIARVIDEKAARQLTRVGTIMGTPGYMAPEQALGDVVDARADVYALGVILWEVATGRTLFDHPDLGAIVAAQMTEDAPRIASLAADAPPDLDGLVARMLSRSRADRPDASEVRETLRRIGLTALAAGRASSALTMPARADDASGRTSVAVPSIVHVNAMAATQFASAASTGAPASPSPTRAFPAAAVRRWMALAAVAAAALACLLSSSALLARGCGAPSPATIATAPKPTAHPSAAITTPSPIAALPAELAADVELLSRADDRDSRLAAAERLSPRSAALPGYARALVGIELARSCNERRDIVRELGELGDPRAIPALERLRELPRRGCGPFGAMDCHRCLRRAVDRALEQLEDDPD